MTQKINEPLEMVSVGDELDSDGEEEDSEDMSDESDDGSEEDAGGNSGEDSSKRKIEDPRRDGQPPSKKIRINKADLYKPPTNEELNQLKETENLFHSSLFRLQINELLSEVHLKEKRKEQLSGWLGELEEVIKAVPTTIQDKPLTKMGWLKKMKVQCPMPLSPASDKGHLTMMPPVDVTICGSYALDMAIKPNPTVDVAVILPKEFVENKDYLNQRYLRKRALFLSCLAAHLRDLEIVKEVQFQHLHGNQLKPVIVCKPSGQLGKHCQVHIHVGLEEGAFRLNRFHISKNNVRPNWYYGTEEDSTGGDGPATPHYNTSVLADMVIASNEETLKTALRDNDGVRDGIILLKVWLRQRQLSIGRGCMSGYIMAMYVAYLIQQHKLSRSMSSYQVMRNTLIHLSQSDWIHKGISLCQKSNPDPHRPSLEEFQQMFSVVFVDSTGYLNLTARMTTAVYNQICHEAQLSISYLETAGIDGFNMLFMTPVTFSAKFDQLIHVSCEDGLQVGKDKLKLTNSIMDMGGDYITASLPKIVKLVEKAVQDRLKLLAVEPLPTSTWSIDRSPPCPGDTKSLTFGLLLDTDHSNMILKRGPPADAPEAATFRAFWGNRSELRRFQDGAICEAVLWPSKTIADRRRVIGKAIKFILHRHAGIPREAVSLVGHQVECVLELPEKSRLKSVPYGIGEEQYARVMKEYDELCRILRRLSDLPLAIHSIQGTSPMFRYAEVFPALPFTDSATFAKSANQLLPAMDQPCPSFTPSMQVVCMLETSGKWPEDKDAVRRLRAAFHITLGNVLRKQHHLSTVIHPNSVSVLKGGYVFQLQVGYGREVALLKMVTTPEGMVKMIDTDESKALDRKINHLPKLTSILHGLQQINGSYCGAVRLAKRWISAQMLADFVPTEAVELIIAYLYLHPAPYTTPSTPQAAFIRFLGLLSTHDWHLVPLLVNLNNGFSKEDYTEIPLRFTKERTTLPLMFISTPDDKMSSQWTRRQPVAPVLQRLVLLAQNSLDILLSQLSSTEAQTDFRLIFRPPLDHYDILITLRPRQLARSHLAVDVAADSSVPVYTEENLEKAGENKIFPVTDYDPVQLYLQELRDAFDDIALFFHDNLGGSVIGVLWKPNVLKPEPFKVNTVNAHQPHIVEDSANMQVVPNVVAILEDFKVIGAGLVKTIEARKDKLQQIH